MAPGGSGSFQINLGGGMKLERRPGYKQDPVLNEDEELVEYRLPESDGYIRFGPGEFIITNTGEHRSYCRPFKGEMDRMKPQTNDGRYIVRKKEEMGTGKPGSQDRCCERCGERYTLGRLREHYENVCTNRPSRHRKTKQEVEVVMAEQKPLSYKRETLIEALKNAVADNENKREQDRKDAAKKNENKTKQLIELLKAHPNFANQMIERAAGLLGLYSESVGTETFKEHVEKNYPVKEEPEVEFDKELKKLIRVYEKAEDETVEVSVDDTAYNYL